MSGGAKNDEYTKFVILCAPRSGSTLLHTYLNSHHQILSHGEIIRRKVKRGEELHSIYEYVFIPQAKKIKAVGLKIFYDYEGLEVFKEAYHEVLQDTSVKIIHLIRQDKRKQLTSLRKARKSGVWSSVLKNEEEFNVEISEREFEEFKQQQTQQIAQARQQIAGHQVTEITYENLVENPKDVLTHVQEFIGVEPKPLFTLLRKQGSA